MSEIDDDDLTSEENEAAALTSARYELFLLLLGFSLLVVLISM